MIKGRNKDKENMIKSMKFETDEDVEIYEQSIYNLVDKEDSKCLYDLVEGYDDDSEFPDVVVMLDFLIVSMSHYYSIRDYILTLSKAIMHLRGSNEESAMSHVWRFINFKEYREIYKEVWMDFNRKELDFHIYLIEKILKEELDKDCEDNIVEEVKGVLKGIKSIR